MAVQKSSTGNHVMKFNFTTLAEILLNVYKQCISDVPGIDKISSTNFEIQFLKLITKHLKVIQHIQKLLMYLVLYNLNASTFIWKPAIPQVILWAT